MSYVALFVFTIITSVFTPFQCANNPDQSCATDTCPLHHDADVAAKLALLDEALDLATSYSTDIKDFARLYDLMESLRRTQKDHSFLRRTYAERVANIDSLKKWCAGKLENLEIESFPEFGLGLRITENIPNGASVSRVMLNETINLVDSKPMFEEFRDAISMPKNTTAKVFWNRHLWLSLRLIYEQFKPDSYWKAYISMLPNTFNIFFYFSPKDMSYLLGSQAYADAIWSYQEMVAQYLQLYRYLLQNPNCCNDLYIEPKMFTYDLYRWAFVLALTRSYEDNINHVMIPCWDLVNHGEGQMETDIHYEKLSEKPLKLGPNSYVHSNASLDLKAGDQLFHQYNDMWSTIDHFFNIWGMVEPLGSLLVQLTLRESDPLYRLKKMTLQLGGYDTSFDIRLVQYGDYPIETQGYAFLVAAATGNTPSEVTQSSWERSWTYLAKYLLHYISRYRISLQQAHKLLAEKNLGDNTKLALMEVITEITAFERARKECLILAKKPMQTINYEEESSDY